MRCTVGVVGDHVSGVQPRNGVTKTAVSRIVLESQTTEGDSPVGENGQFSGWSARVRRDT